MSALGRALPGVARNFRTPRSQSRAGLEILRRGLRSATRLIAYRFGLGSSAQFGRKRILDARCREHARDSLTSYAQNLADGAGRRSRADKSRVYSIALGELGEVAAALELDAQLRGSSYALGEL